MISFPPSAVILNFFNTLRGASPSQRELEAISCQVLLLCEEVNMWLDHLSTVQYNRRRGAAKAAETRRKRKSEQTASPTATAPKRGKPTADPSATAPTRGGPTALVRTRGDPTATVHPRRDLTFNGGQNESCKCGVCDEEYEAETLEEELWIECSSCELWFHGDCVGVNPSKKILMFLFATPVCLLNSIVLL